MGRLTRLLVVAAGAALIAACGEERATETDTERVPAPADALVVYERTGGEQGSRQRLEVWPDGTARVTDGDRGATVELTQEEFDALRAALDAVDFSRLRRRYGSVPVPLGAYQTTLMADGRRVRIVGDARLPPQLESLRAASAALIERHRPR